MYGEEKDEELIRLRRLVDSQLDQLKLQEELIRVFEERIGILEEYQELLDSMINKLKS